jgi:hypothetical protein
MSRAERVRRARQLLEEVEEIVEWEARHGYEGADCRNPRAGELLIEVRDLISE